MQSYLVDALLLAVCLCAFYWLWLGSYPLFIPDEGRYSEVAREMVASGDYITPRVNGIAFLDKPVLYYWLQAAAIHVFGVNEWALRFFPAVFGIGGCLLTYFAGRRLFGRRTGVLSAIILATTPLYFACAHYANLDLEVAVLISACLLFLILGFQAHGDQQRLFYFLAYLFAALAFLTKGLMGVAFPCMIGGAWLLTQRRLSTLRHMHLFSGIVIFLCVVLPWYLLVQKANPEFLYFFFVTQQVTRFLSTAEFNNPSPAWFYVPIVLIGFFPWTAFLAQAIYQSIRRLLSKKHELLASNQLYLLLWAGIILLFFSIPRAKTISYILPIFPPLALLTGHYLANAWDTCLRRMYLSVGTVALFCITLSALFIYLIAEQQFPASAHFSAYLVVITVILVASAILAVALLAKQTLRPLFVLCAICNVLFLLTLTKGAHHLNQVSTKPLVMKIKPILTAQDEVINYYKFYQDVPLYLGQTIKLVANWRDPGIANRDNWVRELWYGMPFQNTDNYLIDDKAFWQTFYSNKRVFVFLNDNYFGQFKKQATHYNVIAKHNDIILLSNQLPLNTHQRAVKKVNKGNTDSTINKANA